MYSCLITDVEKLSKLYVNMYQIKTWKRCQWIAGLGIGVKNLNRRN